MDNSRKEMIDAIIIYSGGKVKPENIKKMAFNDLVRLYCKWFYYWVHGTFKGYDFENFKERLM